MLGKLFKRKSVPNNDGKREPVEVAKLHFAKVFELELSNMEDTPVYALKHQLSVGSEIGNIIIADPSVSPRHASFILQQDVVSVIDHGSVAGTLVNGKKIPPGKYIILEETDVVNVGDLEIRLKVSTKAEALEQIPELPIEEDEVEEIEEAEKEDLPEEIPDLPEEEDEWQESAEADDVEETLQDDQEAEEEVTKPKSSANSLVRLVAVVSDLLLSYSLLVIFMPFDEFRSFLDVIPNLASEFLNIDWTAFLTGMEKENEFLATMLKDLYLFLSSTFHVGPLVLMFFMNRFLTTLLLGVSFSEFMLGIRASGNPLWVRVGGVVRVFVGAFTGPFLIFDIPAIISRRTFKEVITFTRIYVGSRIGMFTGTFLYLPLMLGLAIVSPLLEGLEPPEPIGLNDRIDHRVKVKTPEAIGDETTAVMVEDQSQKLNLKISYNANELTIIPNFKFQGIKSKLNLKSSLVFYQRDLQRQIEVDVFKSFDFRQLLGMGMRGNVPLYDKYPEIYNFVYESLDSNPAFKATNDVASNTAFANEFIEFTKTAFSLGLENAFDVMQNETFLIKGLVNYKSSFLSLIEYKDFDEINFLKIGNAYFMKIGFKKQKPFDLLIPLVKGEGRIFRISYDRKENSQSVASKFYKFNLDKTDWISDSGAVVKEVMSSLEVFDLFSSPDFKKQLLSGQKAQALYGYYFETSASMLNKADPVEIDIWKNKSKSLLKLLESVPVREVEGEENPMEKLLQNFRDLIDALENNNTEYFGIQNTTTV